MPHLSRRDVLEIGTVAKICHSTRQTVAKWCDCGALRSYRVPMSKWRRVQLKDLIEFMRTHRMPEEWIPKPIEP